MEAPMTADIFVAAMAGLTVIAVLIYALTSARDRDRDTR
jgi:hypothetical protein